MMISTWILWLVAALVLLIFELFSGTVAALCISAGCFVAAALAVVGLGLIAQVIGAVVGMILAFIFLGPLIQKYHEHRGRGADATATNMDALVGRVGKVTHLVTENADDHGRVRIDGDSWLAYTDPAHAPIAVGTQVRVLAYDSLVIRVKPVEE